MIRSAIMLGLVLLFAGTTQKASAQTEDVSLQSFYDELSPYGTWIQDPQYGYVWRPDVDQEEFRPYYTNGRWVMTEYGNTWVSNYDWGWAPFHYGRWVYNRYNQWVWLPDTVWGPAWVSWRSGGGYYGWAPLGPSISIGINIGRGGYRIPDMCWNFIPYNNIYYSSYPRYSYNRNRVYIQNTVIINNTYVRNNRTYYTGPRADDIRRATNQNVNVYRLNRSHNPGDARIESNRVNIYQPRASRDNNGTPAPRSVVKGNINRGPVVRDNNANASRGDVRNDNRGNTYQGNRGDMRSEGRPTNSPISRASRGDQSNVGTENRGREVQNEAPTQRPSIFDRTRNRTNDQSQHVERSSPATQPQQQPQPQPQQRPEQRAERNREVQQAQPQPQQQRVERQQSAPQQAPQQRMERPESRPSAPRVERTQPQQRGNSGGESRGGGRASGGRPGRG